MKDARTRYQDRLRENYLAEQRSKWAAHLRKLTASGTQAPPIESIQFPQDERVAFVMQATSSDLMEGMLRQLSSLFLGPRCFVSGLKPERPPTEVPTQAVLDQWLNIIDLRCEDDLLMIDSHLEKAIRVQMLFRGQITLYEASLVLLDSNATTPSAFQLFTPYM